MFALFKNGKQITKAHSTKEAVATEGFEHGYVVSVKGRFVLVHDVEIREINKRL